MRQSGILVGAVAISAALGMAACGGDALICIGSPWLYQSGPGLQLFDHGRESELHRLDHNDDRSDSRRDRDDHRHRHCRRSLLRRLPRFPGQCRIRGPRARDPGDGQGCQRHSDRDRDARNWSDAGGATCSFGFSVTGLPTTSFYQFSTGSRSGVSFSLAQMQSQQWLVSLSIGS